MIKSVRNSNHELLRLLAMYMIVFIHANRYLGYFCGGKANLFFNGMVNGICNVGVTCFVLISGYYGIKFSVKKFVKMECMMITYSLLETVILYIMFPQQMQGSDLLEQIAKSLLPFITRKYWFYSCYICVFFLSGYIKKFVESLDREEFKKLLVLLVILFSVLPTLFYFELVPDSGKGLVQMMTVYMLGRYMSLYPENIVENMLVKGQKKKLAALFVALWAVNGISHEFPIQIGEVYHHLCKDNSITNLMMAVILFYLFKELKIQSAMLNKMASYVFAVFALNNALVNLVFENLVKDGVVVRWKGISTDVLGFFLLVGIVLAVMAVCLLVGAIREALLGRLDRKIGDCAEKIFGRLAAKNF